MYRQLLPLLLRKFTLPACGVIFAALFVASLSGCGNKADLYLPENNATTYSTTFSSANNTLTNNSEL
jgi:predicted small lipoprotein YifL